MFTHLRPHWFTTMSAQRKALTRGSGKQTLAVIAVTAAVLLGQAACSASIPEDVAPPAGELAIPHTSTPSSSSSSSSSTLSLARSTAGVRWTTNAQGGSQVRGSVTTRSSGSASQGAARLGADKATQLTMNITNNTNETLNWFDASVSGLHTQWQGRPVNLAPGQTETVSCYSAGNAQINLSFRSTSSGVVFALMGKTPLVGSNTATGSASNGSYSVAVDTGKGYNPTDTYVMNDAQAFSYTGSTQTYTVPSGVTKLSVAATGGAGGDSFDGQPGHNPANGATVSGTLAVTPGEVLTIGVGGIGQSSFKDAHGGWGMTNGSSDYRGGDGYAMSQENIGGGGGATVILDGNGDTVVVAGGAGGTGGGELREEGMGGRAGYQGSLTGENGGPYGQGGHAGANTVSHGQDATSGGAAGGGGVNGGLAGNIDTQGGGAGSSSVGQLTNTTVQTAPSTNGGPTGGGVTLAAHR